LQLEVAAGSEGLEGFVEHVPRVAKAGEQGAAVDKVEPFSERPGELRVGDLEAAVFGNTVGSLMES
jgi:hypothetical protein